jgi:SpoVK/Ycf46/Vps4 family AAA+-type ATPase
VIRKLRDLSETLKETLATLVITSPIVSIPIELQKSITVVSYPLPGTEELNKLLDVTLENAEISTEKRSAPDDIKSKIKDLKNRLCSDVLCNEKETIIDALKGLTIEEAENVLAKSIKSKHDIDINIIIKEKEQIIKKSGILEFYPNIIGMDDIGGLENIKDWLMKRKISFTNDAREFGLKPPKGLFLTGVSGTGKSLLSKASARFLELPLLRLDVSKIFAKHVGESEQNAAMALRVADAVSPCVMWIDEVEKALSGINSSSEMDAGVTARVFSQLLVWMQEHTTPVFLIVTCNNPSSIPMEFIRRFDEVFFVDLPNPIEREAILKIHLNKIKRDPAKFDLQEHVIDTEGYSGAEIETIIMSALHNTYWDRTNNNGNKTKAIDTIDINDVYLHEAINNFIPLSKKRKEEIDKIREWGIKFAVSASSVDIRMGQEV